MFDRFVARIRGWLLKYQALAKTPRLQRVGWVVALLLFVVVAVGAARSLPSGIGFEIWPAIGALLTSYALLFITTSEIRLIGRLAGVILEYAHAFRLVIMGSLANLAPVPGAATVRVSALVKSGSTASEAIVGNLVVGGVWVSTAVVFGSLAILLGHQAGSWVLGLLAIGVVGLTVSSLVAKRSNPSSRLLFAAISIESSLVLLSGLAVNFGLSSLGYQITFSQSLVVAMSSVVATAVGFFPMGLGLAESLAGATAQLVDLDPGLAVIGTIASRVFSLVALASLSFVQRGSLQAAERSHACEGADN